MGSKKNNLRHQRHSEDHYPKRQTSKGAIRRIAKNQRRNRVRLGSPEREFEAVVNFASLLESGIYQNRGTEEQRQGATPPTRQHVTTPQRQNPLCASVPPHLCVKKEADNA